MAGRRKSPELETAMLNVLARGPRTIKAVRKFVNRVHAASQRTCYRYVADLEARGLVLKLDQGPDTGPASWIVLTPAGATELRRRTLRRSLPEPQIPALYLLPTRIHRLVGGLMICAAIARQDGTPFMANHLSFVLFGDSKKFKTTTAIIVATILGGDPRRDLVITGDCTESNLLYVQDHGKRVPRALLSAPIGIFDEYLDADASVVRRLLSLLQGRPEVSLSGNAESDRFRMGCVPALTGNPKPGTTLSEQTGIRNPILSRCIAVDFTAVEVSKSFRGKSGELIARAKAMGPMALPALRPLDQPKLLDIVPDAMDAILDPNTEGAKLVNCESVAQLVPAARALLESDRDALAYVLFALGEIWELRRWTRPTWREDLARAIGVDIRPRKANRSTASATEAPEDTHVVAVPPEHKALYMEWNRLARTVAELRMAPAELEKLAILETERRAKGSSLAQAAAEQDARLDLGLTAADGKAAMKHASDMAKLQVSLGELGAVGREVAKAATGEGLGRVHELVDKHGSLEESIAAARERLARIETRIAQAKRDEKRTTDFFVELRSAKEWIRRDPKLRPLLDRVESFLNERVVTYADRTRAQEIEDEVTRQLHWLETLRAITAQLESDPLCATLVRQVEDTIAQEGFDRLREMGYLPPREQPADLATPSR